MAILDQILQNIKPVDAFGGMQGAIKSGFDLAEQRARINEAESELKRKQEENKLALSEKAMNLIPIIKNAKTSSEKSFYLKHFASLANSAGMDLSDDFIDVLKSSPEATQSFASFLQAAQEKGGGNQSLTTAYFIDGVTAAKKDPTMVPKILDALTEDFKTSASAAKLKKEQDTKKIEEANKALNESGAPLTFRQEISKLPIDESYALAFTHKAAKEKLKNISDRIFKDPKVLSEFTTPEQRSQIDALNELIKNAYASANDPKEVSDVGYLVDLIETSANNLFGSVAKEAPAKLSPAQKIVDEAFGKEYEEILREGKIATSEQNITSLQEVKEKLEKSDTVTGFFAGRLFPFLNSKQQEIRGDIERSVQPLLRPTFGAQFTEAEGRRFFERVFDKTLDERVNAKRLEIFINELAFALEAKKSMMKYYETNGTLSGFDGLENARKMTNKDFFQKRVLKAAEEETKKLLEENPESKRKEGLPPAGKAMETRESKSGDMVKGGSPISRSAFDKMFKEKNIENPLKDLTDEQFFELIRRSQQKPGG